jgi:Carboxypeptidase regulatory-like domain
MGRNSASLLLSLAMAGFALAQTQPPRADEKPASVDGEGRDTISGLPIERVHVSLRRFVNGGWDRYGAQTNAEGRFTIIGIPAGNYQVAIDRVGYVVPVEITRGQITLHAAEKKDNYKLKLVPVGSITGHVLDADGAPMEGLTVEAELAGKVERSATTDDRGQYRIGGLRPGKYRVRAKTQALPIPPEIRTDGTTEVNYGATYHPGALDSKSATALTVGPASDVIGIDIRMVRTPILRIAGKVTGAPDGIKNLSVLLQQAGAFGSSGTQAKPDGSFEIWRAIPGKYTAIAMANNAGDVVRSVPVDLDVAESDIENIELRMLPPEDVKGQLEFSDENAKPRPPQQRPGQQPMQQTAPNAQQPSQQPVHRIYLRDPSNLAPFKTADIADDGSFTLEKVSAGKYQVSIGGYPAFVKSVRIGQTAEDGPLLDIRSGAAGGALTVTLSSETGNIGGVVSDDKGPYPGGRVVVRDTSNRNITQGAMSAADGTYTIKNLPPGKYKLLVLDEGETNLMTSEANLDDFDDRAETVELHPKETLTRDLKMRPILGR